MAAVWDAVEAFLPWYSSVHRGSGVKSQVSTAAFEDARRAVAEFVGARADDDVVFVRNTTEAINVLSAALPAGTRVLSSAGRAPLQHAALAPPRRSGCSRSPARRTSCWRRASGRSGRRGRDRPASPSPAPRTSRGRCGRSPSWPSSPMRTAPGCSSTPRSSPPTARSTWPASGIDFLALLRPQALRAVRRRRAGRRPSLPESGAAAARRRGDRARDARRRDLGGRPRAPRGRLAERRGSRGARRRLPRVARPRHGRRRRARTGARGTAVERRCQASRGCAG